MKTTKLLCEEAVLQDLEALAPLVKEAFALMEGPSPRILNAIHEEAVAQSIRRSKSVRIPFIMHFAAAAAAVVLLCGGTLLTWRTWHQVRYNNQTVQILRISTQGSSTTDHELANTSELAGFLLSMQGLDHESYFSSPDGTESLWL